jgi:hypothetical protein
VIIRRHAKVVGEALNRKINIESGSGGNIMRKKNILDWLNAMLSLVFYIGLFGGIGYLLQAVIL